MPKFNYVMEDFNPNRKPVSNIPFKVSFINDTSLAMDMTVHCTNTHTFAKEDPSDYLVRNFPPLLSYVQNGSIFLTDPTYPPPSRKHPQRGLIGMLQYQWFNTNQILLDGIPAYDLFKLLEKENKLGAIIDFHILSNALYIQDNEKAEYLFDIGVNPCYITGVSVMEKYRNQGFATYLINSLPTYLSRVVGFPVACVFFAKNVLFAHDLHELSKEEADAQMELTNSIMDRIAKRLEFKKAIQMEVKGIGNTAEEAMMPVPITIFMKDIYDGN